MDIEMRWKKQLENNCLKHIDGMFDMSKLEGLKYSFKILLVSGPRNLKNLLASEQRKLYHFL